jgi:hypothetical protein
MKIEKLKPIIRESGDLTFTLEAIERQHIAKINEIIEEITEPNPRRGMSDDTSYEDALDQHQETDYGKELNILWANWKNKGWMMTKKGKCMKGNIISPKKELRVFIQSTIDKEIQKEKDRIIEWADEEFKYGTNIDCFRTTLIAHLTNK